MNWMIGLSVIELILLIYLCYIDRELLQVERKGLEIEKSQLEIYREYFRLRGEWLASRLRTLNKKAAEGNSPGGAVSSDSSELSAGVVSDNTSL